MEDHGDHRRRYARRHRPPRCPGSAGARLPSPRHPSRAPPGPGGLRSVLGSARRASRAREAVPLRWRPAAEPTRRPATASHGNPQGVRAMRSGTSGMVAGPSPIVVGSGEPADSPGVPGVLTPCEPPRPSHRGGMRTREHFTARVRVLEQSTQNVVANSSAASRWSYTLWRLEVGMPAWSRRSPGLRKALRRNTSPPVFKFSNSRIRVSWQAAG